MPVPIRRLPFRVKPLPDEPFSSWFEYMAYAYDVTGTEMAVALGLDGGDHQINIGRWSTEQWATELTDAQVASLEQATGLEADEFHAMTRARFWEEGIRRGRSGGISTASPTAGLGGRYCPECLDDTDGRWRMSWQLPLGFCCLRHQRILVDTCPQCCLPPRRQPHPLTLTPIPGTCHNRAPGQAGYKQRCRADLTVDTDRLPATRFVLEAQRAVFRILSGGQATFGIYEKLPQPSILVLHDLRLIARLCRAEARNGGRQGIDEIDDALLIDFLAHTSTDDARRSRPEQAVNIAVGVTLAIQTLHHRERVERLLKGRLPASTSYSAHSPQLQELIAASLGRRRRPTTTLQSTHTATNVDPITRACKVPALLWAPWARRLAPRRIDTEIAAEALSAAVVFTGTRLTHAAALKIIDPGAPSRRVTQVMRELGRGSTENATLIALLRLCQYLDEVEPPIDYRRRRALDCTNLLPSALWARICAEANVAPGAGHRHQVARHYLYHRITGNPLRKAPPSWGGDRPIHTGDLEKFASTAPGPVLDRLDDVARAFLTGLAIAEPVTWEPPRTLIDAAEHEATTGARNGDSWPPARPARQLVSLAVPDVADQYADGATTGELAARAGVSRQTISRTLASTSTPTRRGRYSRTVIDPEWLRQKYVDERLTMKQIALIVGCSLPVINRRLGTVGIPIRPRGGSSEAAVLHPHPLAGDSPLLRRTLIGRHAIARARRFLLAGRHPTIRSAAAEIGTSAPSLGAQLERLSRDAGGPLFTKATAGGPMRYTALGRRLARELRAILPIESPARAPDIPAGIESEVRGGGRAVL